MPQVRFVQRKIRSYLLRMRAQTMLATLQMLRENKRLQDMEHEEHGEHEEDPGEGEAEGESTVEGEGEGGGAIRREEGQAHDWNVPTEVIQLVARRILLKRRHVLIKERSEYEEQLRGHVEYHRLNDVLKDANKQVDTRPRTHLQCAHAQQLTLCNGHL